MFLDQRVLPHIRPGLLCVEHIPCKVPGSTSLMRLCYFCLETFLWARSHSSAPVLRSLMGSGRGYFPSTSLVPGLPVTVSRQLKVAVFTSRPFFDFDGVDVGTMPPLLNPPSPTFTHLFPLFMVQFDAKDTPFWRQHLINVSPPPCLHHCSMA